MPLTPPAVTAQTLRSAAFERLVTIMNDLRLNCPMGQKSKPLRAYDT